MGRDVDHEDGAPRIDDLVCERIEAPVQLVLRHLARCLPRRLVRPAVRQQLEAARNVQHLAVRVDGTELVAVQDRVDREVVVVPRDQVERDARVGQALGREPHPRLDALVHQAVEQLVACGRVTAHALRVLLRPDERVEADIGDVALELREVGIAAGGALDAEQLGLVAPVALHDRHDRLPRQVARDQRDVGLVHVELDGVQVLPPRGLGRVEVARDVQAGRDVASRSIGRDLGEEHLRVDAGRTGAELHHDVDHDADSVEQQRVEDAVRLEVVQLPAPSRLFSIGLNTAKM